MNYSPVDEFNRRQEARDADHRRRIAAVVWDPNGPEVQIASEVVGRQLEAEAVEAAKVRAEAYAAMSAECDAMLAGRPVQEGGVPLDSVTVIDDDEPSRPQREPVSMEVERRLALHGGESYLVQAADIEREILLERYEADLAAGLIDDEECPF